MTEPIDQEQTAAAAANNLPAQPADAPAIDPTAAGEVGQAEMPSRLIPYKVDDPALMFTPNPEPADPKPTLIEIPLPDSPAATLVDAYVEPAKPLDPALDPRRFTHHTEA